MLDETLVQIQSDEPAGGRPAEIVSSDEAIQLIHHLQEMEMLSPAFELPKEWTLWFEVPIAELAHTIREHLSTGGWDRILQAMRRHNRQTTGQQWDLSRTADFLAALKLAVMEWDALTGDEKPDRALKVHPDGRSAAELPGLAQDLQQQIRSLMQAHTSPTGIGWLLSPRALITRLSARARHARTEAHIESALSEAALYAARMAGTDAERDMALARVDMLRKQLRNQLRVFCQEQGLPLPKPFSREEAYYLHLLNAYFVALAESEEMIAKRGTALAQRQITLEGERATTRINGKLLPGLLEAQREIDPMREAFFWGRVRHKVALLVGGVVGAIGGGLWGVVESASDVLIGGIARSAPVFAPAILVGLVTLVAQTIAINGPLSPGVVVGFIVRATWNGALALGATLVVYGCWHYFIARRSGGRGGGSAQPATPKKEKAVEHHDGAEATDDVAKRSRPVDTVSGSRFVGK